MIRVFDSNGPMNRRELLQVGGLGLGGLSLSSLLELKALASGTNGKPNPLTGKSVIFLFQQGGPSQLETFDPKPKLAADHGKPSGVKQLLGPYWNFRRGGECEAPVSDLFPHIRECMDDICLIRSMRADHISHMEATLGIHTGSFSVKRPSLGSWVSYGLGTENRDLPSYVVMITGSVAGAGNSLWGSGFLPTMHQGVEFRSSGDPVLFLSNPKGIGRRDRWGQKCYPFLFQIAYCLLYILNKEG